MKSDNLLITGATGILGSWALGEALARGVNAIALLRDRDAAAARERLRRVLAVQGRAALADRAEILLGDITAPGFGISSGEAEDLRGRIGGVIHCAACTSFSPHKDDALWRTNVEATGNLVDFLEDSGAPLYHVSTAYVAGMWGGTVFEDSLPLDSPCKNTYEKSKRAAEALVNAAFARGRLSGAIFRPSIIVGAADSGAISQFLNFYSILRYVDALAGNGLDGEPSLRIQGNPNATLNLVPVDWVARALWKIVETEGASGRTYHLTHPAPPSQRGIAAWASGVLRESDGTLSFQSRLEGSIGRHERAANEAMCRYRAYLAAEPVFDRTNTERALGGALPVPRMGPAFFDALLAYAREQQWTGVFGCGLRVVEREEAPPAALDIERLQRDLREEAGLRPAV